MFICCFRFGFALPLKSLMNLCFGQVWQRETAHQIGTPLSSMIGWIEIMKLDKIEMKMGLVEINKDINRLKPFLAFF